MTRPGPHNNRLQHGDGLRGADKGVPGWGGFTADRPEPKGVGMDHADVVSDGGLFEIEAPPPVSLRDRFGVPPFSVLDRRSGEWQDRRRRWLSLGIRSELGRDGGLIASDDTGYVQAGLPMEQRSDRALEASAQGNSREAEKARQILSARRMANPDDASTDKTMTSRPLSSGGAFKTATQRMAEEQAARREFSSAPVPGGGAGGAWMGKSSSGKSLAGDPKWDRGRLNEAGAHADQDKLNAITGQETLSGTSIFDPVICELAYRWFTAPGYRILDPFAGGSVRGLVAAMLERHYMGIDLRPEQIHANREQVGLLPESKRPWAPRWAIGDSNEVLDRLPAESVDFVWSCPPYADLEVYSDDPRDLSTMSYEEFLDTHDSIVEKACRALKPDRFAAWVISDVRDRKGIYRSLHHDSVTSFKKAGLGSYNEQVILDPVGSAAVRAARIFNGGRKTTRMHQLMYVFIKGDPKRATLALGASEQEEEQ